MQLLQVVWYFVRVALRVQVFPVFAGGLFVRLPCLFGESRAVDSFICHVVIFSDLLPRKNDAGRVV